MIYTESKLCMAPNTGNVFTSLFEKTNKTEYCDNRKAKSAYDTCSKNGVEYIAQQRGGSLEWVPNDYKGSVKNTKVTFALLSRRQ